MSSEPPTTSTLRQATIAAITHVASSDPDAARLLGVELDALSYERRTDDNLFDLADRIGVPADKLGVLAHLSASRYPEHATTLCPTCRDTQSVDRGDGRFVRCPACNPEPVTEEPE